MKPVNSIFRFFVVFCFAMRRDKYLKPKPFPTAVLMATVLASLPIGLWAESGNDGQTDLAKKLANPIANLISIPIQANRQLPRPEGRSLCKQVPVLTRHSQGRKANGLR